MPCTSASLSAWWRLLGALVHNSRGPLTGVSRVDLTVNLLWILGAFVAFVAFIWSVHTIDDYALIRYGYAPFAMPNVLFMLIPNSLLLFSIRNGSEQGQLLVVLAGTEMLGMLLLVRSRTNLWIALFASLALAVGAPLLFFSVLFRGMAQAAQSDGD